MLATNDFQVCVGGVADVLVVVSFVVSGVFVFAHRIVEVNVVGFLASSFCLNPLYTNHLGIACNRFGMPDLICSSVAHFFSSASMIEVRVTDESANALSIPEVTGILLYTVA